MDLIPSLIHPDQVGFVNESLAAAIRANSCIKGLLFHHAQHRISLFAVDIILMIADPVRSLPFVSDTLKQFSRVSYYKVNETKSLILKINLWKSDTWGSTPVIKKIHMATLKAFLYFIIICSTAVAGLNRCP